MVSLPLRHLALTSPFGYRLHPVTGKYCFHSGVDLRAHKDTVFAVLPGTVMETSVNPLLGVYIRLDHGNFRSSYGHLSQIFVLPGDTVAAGAAIGLSGSTGRVTGEHLHFSIQYKHRYINPLAFLYAISTNTKK
jgi:murein DD-endopeptidase MepM/ murein hydrolase activator NlpD